MLHGGLSLQPPAHALPPVPRSAQASATQSLQLVSDKWTTFAASVSEDAAAGYHTVLDESGFTAFFARSLQDAHLYLDMPYWQIIVVASLGIRLVNFPLFMRSMASGARMKAISLHTKAIQEKMRAAQAEGDLAKYRQWGLEMRALMKKHDVGIGRSLLPILTQLPLAFGMIWALRELVVDAQYIPDFHYGGAMWFNDLSLPDPLYALPAASLTAALLALELNPNKSGIPAMGVPFATLRKVSWGMSIFFGLISTQFPAAMQLYFAMTSVSFAIQQSLHRSKWVQRFYNMPATYPDVTPLPLPGQSADDAKVQFDQQEKDQRSRLAESSPLFSSVLRMTGQEVPKPIMPTQMDADRVAWNARKAQVKAASTSGGGAPPPPPPPPSLQEDAAASAAADVPAPAAAEAASPAAGPGPKLYTADERRRKPRSHRKRKHK